MKTRAAVVSEPGAEWEVVELDLDPPQAGEVLVRFVACGLCHSDEHLRTGNAGVAKYPMVGGHEGAGVVEAVGEGVRGVAVGDHVVVSFVPACGHCRFCATGHSNICDVGAHLADGSLPDGTFRFHRDGVDYGAMCIAGAFSQYSVVSEYSVVKVPADLPLETLCLTACGVPTGVGSATHAAQVVAGDTVVVYGIGGVGINSVQGAAIAGARTVIAVDPVAFKRDTALKLGATHAAATADEAAAIVLEVTEWVGADKTIVTAGTVTSEVVNAAFDATRKGGTVVVTGLADWGDTISIPSSILTLFQKTVKGTLFGSGNPFDEIPKMVQLYRSGQLKLDEIITKRYSLDEVAQGYRDMLDGTIIRGVLVHEH